MIGHNGAPKEYEGEVLLLGYGWNPDKGHWITLALNVSDAEGHPFNGFKRGLEKGQRFQMTFTPILDNEEQPEGPRRRWHEMPASQQAGILCADPQFHQWVAQALFPTAIGFKPHVKADVKCAEWVREQCGVISRSELDTDPEARAKWDALVSQFRQDTGREPERR